MYKPDLIHDIEWKLKLIDDKPDRSPEWKALRQYYLERLPVLVALDFTHNVSKEDIDRLLSEISKNA